MSGKHRAVLFDVHGVLIDDKKLYSTYLKEQARLQSERLGGSLAHWSRVNAQMMERWPDYWRRLNLKGEKGLEELWRGMRQMAVDTLEQMGMPASEPDIEWMLKELPYEVGRLCRASYPEVPECLARLKEQGLIQCVASSAISIHTRGLLEGSGIEGYFAFIFGPDNIGLAEKGQGYYRRALNQMGLGPEECAVVDDSPHSIAAAKDIGLRTVLVDRAGKLEPLGAADFIIHGLDELAKAL